MTEQLLTQWETEARDPRFAGSPECVLMLIAEVRRLQKELSGWHAQMSSFKDVLAQKNRDIERLQTVHAEVTRLNDEQLAGNSSLDRLVTSLRARVAEMEAALVKYREAGDLLSILVDKHGDEPKELR